MGRVKYTPEILANLREAALRDASLEELVNMSGARTASGLFQSIRLKLKQQAGAFPRDKLREYWSEWRHKKNGKPLKTKTKKRVVDEKDYEIINEHLIDFVSLLLDKKPCLLEKIIAILRKSLKISIHEEKIIKVLEEYAREGLIVQENEKYRLSRSGDTEKYLAFLKNREAEDYSQGNKLSAPYPVDRTLINSFLDYLETRKI